MAQTNILELGKELLKKVDIVDVISAFLKVSKRGKNYWALCPFHDDHNDSLCISRERQQFTCWSCHETGDAISFVKKYRNCTYKEALKIICEMNGIQDERLNDAFQKRAIDVEHEQVYKCLESIYNYYQGFLTQTDEGRNIALEYLHNRGLTDDIISKFKIGYALKDNEYIIKRLTNDGYSLKTIEKTGIGTIYNGNIKDNNAGRVVFSICNSEGKIVGFSARRLDDDDTKPKYVNTPEIVNGVFHKSNILYNFSNAINEAKRLKYIYVVEGFMDAIAVDRVGIKNVCALMGTAFTKEHIKLLRYLNAEIRLCLDNDAPGQLAMLKTIKDLRINNINYKLVSNHKIMENKDCDEILKNSGSDSLKEYLANVISEGEFVINYYSNNLDLNKLEDKKALIIKIIPYLKSLNNNLDKEFYIKKLANVTDYSVSTIANLIKEDKDDISKQNDDNFEKNKFPRKNKILTKLQLNEKVLMHYILISKDALKQYNDELGYFVNDTYRDLAKLIDDYVDSENVENYDEKDIINYINSKDNDALYKNMLNEISEITGTKLPPYSKESFDDSVTIIKNEREKSRDEEAYKNSIKGKSETDKTELAKILLEKRRAKLLNKEGK